MFRIVQRTIGLLATLLVFLSGPCLHAQAPIVEEPNYTPTLTFDVATIRLSPPPDANFHVSVSSPPHSSRFEATNLPIKALLQIAYGFDAPVVDAPDWVKSTFYDIHARSDEAADARLAKLTDNEVRLEKRNAIRVLLAERLSLKTHLETRNSSTYHLVVDKTGLIGTYNYTLQFGREWSANDQESWPSIFTAVQEQLGLKLEAVHESIPNLVIDHITKPTEN